MLYVGRNCGKRFRLGYASSGYNLVMGSSTSERIVKTPEICGGRARIAGHRVFVLAIVTLPKDQGLTPAWTVGPVPPTPLPHLHAAPAYPFYPAEQLLPITRGLPPPL